MSSSTRTARQRRPAKAKMGRPPVADADKRDIPLKVLVTDAEKSRMEALAARRGLTISTWLRSLGLEALERASGAA